MNHVTGDLKTNPRVSISGTWYKTLLDALTISVLPIPIDTPGADGRIYTLLEDDKLVSRLSVETDRSLVIDSKSREVLTILSVSVFAVRGTLANIGIAL